MKYHCIIFDCDGVLVDSERIAGEVLSEVIAELGCTMGVETATAWFKGGQMAETITLLERELGQTLPQTFESEFRARMAQAFEARLQPIPGVEAILQQL